MDRFRTLLIGSTALLSALSASSAQAQAFQEGGHTVSVGHGAVTFLGNLNRTFDLYTDLNYKGLGPLYLKYEYGVTDRIGLGVNIAYATNEWSYRYQGTDENGNAAQYTESTERNTYSVLARFNYHFGNSDRFDPYFGFGMGYRDANWKFNSSDPNGGSGVEVKSLMPFGFEFTLGARYFFTDNIGLYAEVGGAKSVFQGGLVAKF
ncbi:MAG: outer membrane beta-barrel protein [Flavobacteriales bacterium]|nr:outer membrane beta-barrel protein [Flavobacteriales bacterium]